jgi:hypothetical protein
MNSLSDLLLKYKIPGVRSSQIRKICAEEVLALTGCSLQPSQLQYRNEKLTLTVAPVLKSALLLRQVELIQKIQARDVVVKIIQ